MYHELEHLCVFIAMGILSVVLSKFILKGVTQVNGKSFNLRQDFVTKIAEILHEQVNLCKQDKSLRCAFKNDLANLVRRQD